MDRQACTDRAWQLAGRPQVRIVHRMSRSRKELGGVYEFHRLYNICRTLVWSFDSSFPALSSIALESEPSEHQADEVV
jgi:predicted ATPase